MNNSTRYNITWHGFLLLFLRENLSESHKVPLKLSKCSSLQAFLPSWNSYFINLNTSCKCQLIVFEQFTFSFSKGWQYLWYVRSCAKVPEWLLWLSVSLFISAQVIMSSSALSGKSACPSICVHDVQLVFSLFLK